MSIRKDDIDNRRVLACMTNEGTLPICRITSSSHAIHRAIEAAFGQGRVTPLMDELDTLGDAHAPI
ncbi:hypothetical protein [Celeribacter sp. ULVN23_4]